MFRTFFPIAAIIISVIVLFTYVKPTLNEVKGIQSETREYSDVIANAKQFNDLIQTRVAEMDTIGVRNLARLDKFLPNDIDEVRFLYDIDTIAKKHRMLFGNISVEEDTEDDDSGTVSFVEMSFALIGSYEQFKNVLKDFEQSLALTEVTEINFSAGEGDLIQFELTVRTFQLSYKNQ